MFIELHRINGCENIFINSQFISAFGKDLSGCTGIWLLGDGGCFSVQETPEQILKMIEESK